MANPIISTIKGAKEAMDNYYAATSGNVNRWIMPGRVKKMKMAKLEQDMKNKAREIFKEQTGRDFVPDYDAIYSSDMAKMNSIMRGLKK